MDWCRWTGAGHVPLTFANKQLLACIIALRLHVPTSSIQPALDMWRRRADAVTKSPFLSLPDVSSRCEGQLLSAVIQRSQLCAPMERKSAPLWSNMKLALVAGALAAGGGAMTTVEAWRLHCGGVAMTERFHELQRRGVLRPLCVATLRRAGVAGLLGAAFGALFEPVILPLVATKG